MAIRIQLRRDAASAWSTNNPVLLAGEFGVETDTLKIKIGDGITAWNDLDYAIALPADVSAYVQAEVAAVIDSAPGTLDTLNELAAALGDDPNFATTVSSELATKASATDLTSHTSATTNVHGIADTAALETQTGAQEKATTAENAAKAYADSLAPNYDPAGSATAAETAANAYTDSAIADFDALPDQTSNSGKFLTTDGTTTSWGVVDVSGEIATHNADTTNVHGIADTSLLETTAGAQAKADAAQSVAISTAASDATSKANAAQAAAEATASADATSKANAAQSAAEAYADSLAPNYDPAGSAAAAQSAAQTYADTAVAGLVDAAPETLDTLNELAAALGDDPNFATTVATQIGLKADSSALTAHEADTTNVHGISDTANLVYTNDARLSDTRTPTDNTVSTAKIVDGAVTSAKIADGTIVDADISASADIAQSKIANLTSDLSSKAPTDSPTFTGTVTFETEPSVGSSYSISYDGAVVTQIRENLSMYSPYGGQNALIIFYGEPYTVPSADLSAAQAITSGTQITVNTGSSTYTFTATGPGADGGGGVLVIPGSGGNTGNYFSGSSIEWSASSSLVTLSGATFTGNVSVVSPTAADSTGVRQTTISTAPPTGGSDGDVWIVYA